MEASSSAGVDDVVILPNNLKSLGEIFSGTGGLPDSLTPKQQIVKLYSINALEIGRSLDSAIILMAGQTGSGKSTTINNFFDDAELCRTSNIKSETSKIYTVEKVLKVTMVTPVIQGKICCVDMPGSLDTGNNDAINLAGIRKFRKEFEGLAVRKVLNSSDDISIREKVYPNIILFLVSASDDRMGDCNSSLVKSLKAFKLTSDLIDYERNNVIVVMTHALSMGSDEDCYQEELEVKTKIIQEQFHLHLNLNNVVVVPVENKPKKHKLKKVEDFFELPNGQISHLNLFKEIQKCLVESGDLLGRILTSHYFSNCPEKTKKATIKEFDFVIGDDDLEMATDSLETLVTGLNLPKIESGRLFNFQSMGRGFCPVTETVKPSPFADLGTVRQVDIGNSKFSIPSLINIYGDAESKYRRLTFLERTEYQNHKKAEYGIHGEQNFVFQGNSEGRWVNNTDSRQESSQLLLRHEIQVAKFSLDNHRQIKLNIFFKNDLDSLPEYYNPEQYSAFFSRWGTHYIYDEAVGGALQMKCSISKSEVKNKELKSIDASVSTIFDALCKVGAGVSCTGTLTELRKLGVSNEFLGYTGGDPPILSTLGNSKPEEIEKWAKSVYLKPAELISSIKIVPYCDLMPLNKKCYSLRKATELYLKGELEMSKESRSRNSIALQSINKFVRELLEFLLEFDKPRCANK